MNMNKAKLAAALSAAIGMGFAGQAAAYVYAGSALDISDLTLTFRDATGGLITGINPNFTFNVEDSATLNGANDANAAACSSFGGCGVAPVLSVDAANAPGGDITRLNSNYSLFGPGSGTYANSNTEITDAQLVTGSPTATSQVAESELAGGNAQGQASTNIQSNTTFTLNFTLLGATGPASLELRFLADPELQAEVNQMPWQLGLAQANVEASFDLNRTDGGSESISWDPQGTAANDCNASGGASCAEVADSEDLNRTLGIGTANGNATYSLGNAATSFGIDIGNLSAGNYSLTFAALTSTNVTSVPEPGILALLGAGFAATGVSAMRRRRKAAAQA